MLTVLAVLADDARGTLGCGSQLGIFHALIMRKSLTPLMLINYIDMQTVCVDHM